MAAARRWTPDEMFALVRRAAPYADPAAPGFRRLPRLPAGPGPRWAGRGCPRACARTATAHHPGRRHRPPAPPQPRHHPRRGGGPGPDPGNGERRRRTENETSSPFAIGEVDQSFADRLQPGDRFLLDGRCPGVPGGRKGGAAGGRRCRAGRGCRAGVARAGRCPPSWPAACTCCASRLPSALREGPAVLAGCPCAATTSWKGWPWTCWWTTSSGRRASARSPIRPPVWWRRWRRDRGRTTTSTRPSTGLGNDALARVAVHRLTRDHGRSATLDRGRPRFRLTCPGGLDRRAGQLRTLLRVEDLDADLDAAWLIPDAAGALSAGGVDGVHAPAQPLGRRPRGGRRRLGEPPPVRQVRARDPDFVLLAQAAREVRTDFCAPRPRATSSATSAAGRFRCAGSRTSRRSWKPGRRRAWGGVVGGNPGRGAAAVARRLDGRSRRRCAF